MILRRGELLSLFLSLVCLQLCFANECIEAVEEACSQVIEENNDQLLETMEEMVANRSCDNSAPLLDDDIILNISNQFKDIIKDDLEIIRNATKEQFEQLSQKLVHSMLGKKCYFYSQTSTDLIPDILQMCQRNCQFLMSNMRWHQPQ